ncbi:unnamed protein product [Lasius platythorax]|uniref:Uncharacterized protein n=1 Tax=Lasius platythorax TaxID=488582 RepID=A0AAV2NNK9_9HYME
MCVFNRAVSNRAVSNRAVSNKTCSIVRVQLSGVQSLRVQKGHPHTGTPATSYSSVYPNYSAETRCCGTKHWRYLGHLGRLLPGIQATLPFFYVWKCATAYPNSPGRERGLCGAGVYLAAPTH